MNKMLQENLALNMAFAHYLSFVAVIGKIYIT